MLSLAADEGENSPVIYPDNDDDNFSDADTEASDTTVCSMSTLSSLEVSSFFREVYGRAYPADTNIPAFVPLDAGEAVRLELQHYYLKLLIQSNYFGPLVAHLAPDTVTTRRKRILDIFTAEGTWVQEMATEFPHVDFVSLDMIPLVPHAPRANVMFEVYDVYNGLTELDASFDVVHTRRTVSQIRDYHAFLREIDRVLKPGGLLLFGQLEVEVYEYVPSSMPHPDPIPPSPDIIPAQSSLPIMSSGMNMLRNSLAAQNCYVNMWHDLPTLLLPRSPLWTQRITDFCKPNLPPTVTYSDGFPPRPAMGLQLGYRSISAQAHILPTSPWHATSPRLRAIGELVQQIGVSNWANFGLLFRQQGLSEEDTRELVDTGLAELAAKDICKVMRYHTVHAIKV